MKITPIIALLLAAHWIPAVAETHEDQPPKLVLQKGDTQLVYPTKMQLMGIFEGQVDALIDINADGTVSDWIILKASHPGFIEIVDNTIGKWRFLPLLVNGEPTALIAPAVFKFDYGVLANSNFGPSVAMAYLNSMFPYRDNIDFVGKLRQLDATPHPIQTVSPRFLRDVPMDQQNGKAVFSFFIDHEGKVRMPVLTELSGPEYLAESAVDALLQWRFSPPRKAGKPIIVRASQEFLFDGDAVHRSPTSDSTQ
jgi:hypothetical protein